jgi:ribonuclease III family protein
MIQQHDMFHHTAATIILLVATTIVIFFPSSSSSSLISIVHCTFLGYYNNYRSVTTTGDHYDFQPRQHQIKIAVPQKQHLVIPRWIESRKHYTRIHRSSCTKMKKGHNDEYQDSFHNHVSIEASSDKLFNIQRPFDVFRPSPKCRVELMSPTDLAYIGDSVYELFVRCRHVWPPKRTSDLQNIVVNAVCAESQSKLYQLIRNAQPTDDPFINVDACFNLTSYEQQVLTRGRNSNHIRKQHKNPVAYQESTGFEALLGYMYITNLTRCQEFLTWINRYGR